MEGLIIVGLVFAWIIVQHLALSIGDWVSAGIKFIRARHVVRKNEKATLLIRKQLFKNMDKDLDLFPLGFDGKKHPVDYTIFKMQVTHYIPGVIFTIRQDVVSLKYYELEVGYHTSAFKNLP